MSQISQAEISDAYAGRRVLITGASGFIGLNLTAALHAAKAQVCVLGRSGLPAPRSINLMLDEANCFRGDIRDSAVVERAVTGCELVFHLAGKSGAVASNASPLADLDVNGRGTLTLLEACRRMSPSPKVVFPSSRLVYSPDLTGPVSETSPTVPLSVYGIHKLMAERYLLLYQRLYGLRVSVLRITNPYGPFQRPEQSRYGIVNWFIHQAIHGRPLTIYGHGAQLRDYIHVDDVVQAMLLAGIKAEADGRLLNVGSSRGVSFVDMAELIVRNTGRGSLEHVDWPTDAAGVETGDFVADVSLIKACLGWSGSVPIEVGIADVIGRYGKFAPTEP